MSVRRTTDWAIFGVGVAVGVCVAAASTSSARLKPEHVRKFDDLVAAQVAVTTTFDPALTHVENLRHVGEYLSRVSVAAKDALDQHLPNRAVRLLTEGRRIALRADSVMADAIRAARALDDGEPDDPDGGTFQFVAEPPMRTARQ